MKLNAQQSELLNKVGIDVSNWNWTKILALIETLIAVFKQGDKPEAAASLLKGCPAEDQEHCCVCMEAAGLSLEAANKLLEHCSDCCDNSGG